MALLRAFQRARRSADMMLLIAGDIVSTDLARSARTAIAQRPWDFANRLSRRARFLAVASAVDACVNLRYPMAGETSMIAIRLMGLGKPVLLSTGEETSRFPESSCLRVDTGRRRRKCWRNI